MKSSAGGRQPERICEMGAMLSKSMGIPLFVLLDAQGRSSFIRRAMTMLDYEKLSPRSGRNLPR
jgi:hypothetical protein